MGVLRARRSCAGAAGTDIGNEVDDQVGFDVAQDEVAAKEPVLEFFGQRRQLQQQARRHGRQRQRRGIVGIDGRRHLHRYLDQDGFLIPERPPVEILGDDVANFLSGGRRKYVALMGAGAFDSNLVGQRLFAARYLRGSEVSFRLGTFASAVLWTSMYRHVIEELLEARIFDRIRRIPGLCVELVDFLDGGGGF